MRNRWLIDLNAASANRRRKSDESSRTNTPGVRFSEQRRRFLIQSAVLPVCGSLLATVTAAETKTRTAKPKGNVKLAAPGPNSWASFRNGNQQLGVAKSKLPKKLELLWAVPAKDGVINTPAIVGDRVYVGVLGGDLVCLNLKSGKQIWSYRSIENKDPKKFAPGFQSSPTVTADSVYIGDEDGVFHAVDRATGKQRWKFETNGEIVSSTSIVGDRLIFGSYDSSLYCLNAKDGSKVWQVQTQDRVNGSPAISGDFTFVTGCDEHLRVINIESGQEEYAMNLETYLIASPAVIGDMLYVGTYASEVIAVNWKTQQVVWRYKDPRREFPYHASAAVTDQFVVVGGRDKQLHCIDRKTGDGIWVFPTRSRIDSSPVIVGDRIFFGGSDKNLYEVNLKTGKQTWKFNAGKGITGSPAVGENHLVIGSESSDGLIYCFGAKN